MKVKLPLIIAGIFQMLFGIIMLLILLNSDSYKIIAWVSILFLLLLGLTETIISAISSA